MKKKVILLIFFFIANLSNNCLYAGNGKSMKDIKEIKNDVRIGKKYKVNDELVFFKNILIGYWSSPHPYFEITFEKNKKFSSKKNSNNENLINKGVWDIQDNHLILKYSNSKLIKYEIEYFVLFDLHSEIPKGLPLPKHRYIVKIVFVNKYPLVELNRNID